MITKEKGIEITPRSQGHIQKIMSDLYSYTLSSKMNREYSQSVWKDKNNTSGRGLKSEVKGKWGDTKYLGSYGNQGSITNRIILHKKNQGKEIEINRCESEVEKWTAEFQ